MDQLVVRILQLTYAIRYIHKNDISSKFRNTSSQSPFFSFPLHWLCSSPRATNYNNNDNSTMSRLNPNRPRAAADVAPSVSTNNGQVDNKQEVQAARRGLLKAMWSASVAPRFSSKPIDMEDYFSNAVGTSIASDGNSAASPPTPTQDFRNSLVSSSNLTRSERYYLENLLQSDDLESIRRASMRLSDSQLFPPAQDPPECSHKVSIRRDSDVQQHLFRLHQENTVKPSIMLKRMSTGERSLRRIRGRDPPEVNEDNSITQEGEDDGSLNQDQDFDDEDSPEISKQSGRKWNPFTDVNSWIDGNEGVEIDGGGNPAIQTPTSMPFKILGTSANDTSCHPHVLSPPLMEGLQAFMPESLLEYHHWLKYSLVRDGANLMSMLRHCRASPYTILAIETTEGHVFGSFTAHPWRLASSDFFGGKDSFVWRMRRSRNEPCTSIVEQALFESKMDVFPFTYRNQHVQFCTTESICLGDTEVEGMATEGTHYGNAIRLDGALTGGSTSTSETFGNPCLIETDKRGQEFQVANIELWAMTPHSTVAAAERAEMKSLFLEEGRMAGNKLNLLEIMVSVPV
jgi:hypothetical protein